jgi:predicted outer membrane repeat protein
MNLHFCRGFAAVLLLLLACPGVCSASVLTVRQDGSGDYLTISAALTAAAHGDTIDVGPGIYAEQLRVEKSILLLGSSGAAVTVLDGKNSFQPLRFDGSTLCELEGFTIAKGCAAGGGGLAVADAEVTVRECEFRDNTATFDGGAFYAALAVSRLELFDCAFFSNTADHNAAVGNVIRSGHLTIARCVFAENSCPIFSAGIAADHSTMNVSECLFWGNSSGDVAGAIYFYRSTGAITNCTFHRNSAPGAIAGAVVIQSCPAFPVRRCIFANQLSGYGLRYYGGSQSHSCNVFWQNASGPIGGGVLGRDEIVADPQFCDPGVGDFHLANTSPAAPANNPCGLLIGAFPVGCGPVALEAASWGKIKALYR